MRLVLPEGEKLASIVKTREGVKPYLVKIDGEEAPKWSSLAGKYEVVKEKVAEPVQEESDEDSSDDEAPEEVTNQAAPAPVFDAPAELSSKKPAAEAVSEETDVSEAPAKAKRAKPAKTAVIPHSERLALLEQKGREAVEGDQKAAAEEVEAPEIQHQGPDGVRETSARRF